MNAALKTTKHVKERSALGKSLLAKVHVAKKQLGLSDDDYRAVLLEQFGQDSAGQLSDGQLRKLIAHFRGLGWQDAPKARSKADAHGRPGNLNRKGYNSRTAMMKKIEAMLAEKGTDENGFIPWSYAASILKRQCGVERLEFASPEQLSGVIAALYRDAQRKGRETE
ncbi:regulatory protein GemA [Desulfocurvibacter africanus]|uniref:regulatory protein GemA n=1 Tax=Desulfocurvibacter africanus TaxID=873 RepID=UPI000407574B|nr:regulatory protein GemA [Desulfocurvibacter africanus]